MRIDGGKLHNFRVKSGGDGPTVSSRRQEGGHIRQAGAQS